MKSLLSKFPFFHNTRKFRRKHGLEEVEVVPVELVASVLKLIVGQVQGGCPGDGTGPVGQQGEDGAVGDEEDHFRTGPRFLVLDDRAREAAVSRYFLHPLHLVPLYPPHGEPVTGAGLRVEAAEETVKATLEVKAPRLEEDAFKPGASPPEYANRWICFPDTAAGHGEECLYDTLEVVTAAESHGASLHQSGVGEYQTTKNQEDPGVNI